jgi:outer membrane lipoprotein SlyB
MLRSNRPALCALAAALSLASIAEAEAQSLPDLGHALGRIFHSDPGGDEKSEKNGALACAGGGALGGFLGSRLGGRHNPVGSLFGAVGGCLIASAVAKELTKNEQVELAERTQASFDGGSARTTYYSKESHKSVYISRGEEVVQRREVEIATLDGVQAPAAGDFIVVGRPAYAKGAVRLHAAPDASSATIGGYRKGQTVMIMGRTRDGVWNLIGAHKTLVGYAATNLFAAKRPSVKKSAHTAASTPQTAAPKLDNGQQLETQKVVETKVAADTTCAQAQQKVGSASGTVTGCKSPYGGWNVI